MTIEVGILVRDPARCKVGLWKRGVTKAELRRKFGRDDGYVSEWYRDWWRLAQCSRRAVSDGFCRQHQPKGA